MKSAWHLIDEFPGATVTAPRAEYVGIQPITIGLQTRMGLFQHPTSTVEFPGLSLGKRPVLRFGCGIKEVAWPRLKSTIRFAVVLIGRHGREHPLCIRDVDPGRNPADRCWHDLELDLSPFAGQTVTLKFVTSLAGGEDASYCWAGWSDPLIEHHVSPTPVHRRRDSHRHLLLITADALRADHLGCYGHPLVKTPHLDQLAREGVLFRHARSQATTTPTSNATLLTGVYPAQHGIVGEWGQLHRGVPTLPEHLAAHGYQTVVAASEAEISEGQDDLVRRFAENVPCLGQPAQSGDVTVRQFVRWLDRRAQVGGPFFAWLHLFDAHPPATPPEPFRSLYYQGDPRDEMARYASEKVRQIRGAESALDLDVSWDHLLQGTVPTTWLERLHATAETLLGLRPNGPDLASHLRSLGSEAWNGLALPAFAGWLREQVTELREGSVTPALMAWLHDLRPRLRAIEAEIVSWLNGVVDFRYPLSQYAAKVSYLDHHIGMVLAALKERGLYEQTLIAFASPHGELLDDCDMVLHHHALMESVLRVPVLLKPSSVVGRVEPDRRVAGILDLIDLLPTLLDGLGVAPVPGLDGVSRWQHVRDGSPIPDHDSIAMEQHHCMVSLARPPFIFVKALRPYFLCPGWTWRPGDTALFELQSPMRYDRDLKETMPDVAAGMEQRLDAWLRRWSQTRPASARAA